MIKMTRILCLLLVPCISVYADVQLNPVFSDHMVLQEDKPLKIWGQAAVGEKINVALQSQKKSTVADAKGQWSVLLTPLKAGGPFVLTVSGKNKLVVNDVLIGEVWVCSGQSNMEWPLGKSANADKVVPAATNGM